MTSERDAETSAPTSIPEWVLALGISDRKSAIEQAYVTPKKITDAALSALQVSNELTRRRIVLMGLITRAQCLADGAAHAIDGDNPHSSFTLIRAYFENAAALVYVIDKPEQMKELWSSDGHGIKVGKIVNHARTRFPEGKEIYDQLSKYAHPHSISIVASMQLAENGMWSWASGPRFKHPEELIMAAAWLVQLTDATVRLINQFTQMYCQPMLNPSPVKEADETELGPESTRLA